MAITFKPTTTQKEIAALLAKKGPLKPYKDRAKPTVKPVVKPKKDSIYLGVKAKF